MAIDQYQKTHELQLKIENAINYIAAEYELSTTDVLGVLELVKHNVLHESWDERESECDNETDR